MNVSLTPELVRLVHQRVESGMYSTASEVVREALRSFLDEKNQSQSLTDDVILNATQWQDMREALLRGEDYLTNERSVEIARLFRTALETKRIQLQRDMPEASAERIEGHIAQWLQEQAGAPDGGPDSEVFGEISEERRKRLFGE